MIIRKSRRALIVAMVVVTSPSLLAQSAKLDPSKIDAAIGGKGAMIEAEGVYKVTFPRIDIPIAVDGRTMEPFMGFTSWAAFQPGKGDACMVMGDLVLFEDEVNPVMSALLDAGAEVTALHNHFFFDDPKVYFMHIGGEGDQERLAAAVKKAFDEQKQVRSKNAQPVRSFGGTGARALTGRSSITPKPIEDLLGAKGQAKDGMLKVVIGRKVKMACGCEVGKEMGINTWAAFAGSDAAALVDGDFAVLEDELQPVLKALRKANINVVAIHQHMIGEAPRMIFLHYWSTGSAAELATGLKSALVAQSAVRGSAGSDK